MKEPNKESQEMYLECIYVLSQEGKQVRSVDIARYLGNARPTVSERLPKLQAKGLIERKPASAYITLTKKGENAAKHIYERHQVLSHIFCALGVTPNVATEDACRVEHYISDETFDAIRTYYANHFKDSSATK